MSLATAITPAILDKSLHVLAPLFLTTADDDLPTARHAAGRLLASYEIQTEEELCLVTAFIGFAFGALEALSQSMAPGLTPDAILRLRGNASAQQRSANQCRRTFERLRKQRWLDHGHSPAKQPDPEAVAADLAMPRTPTLGDYARTPPQPAPAISLSRQRRRSALGGRGTRRRENEAKRLVPKSFPGREQCR